MNLIRYLICQLCFTLALRHAYLEALLHKALDPVFGNRFISSFLGSHDTNSFTFLDLMNWNQKAMQSQSSAWLPKLNQDNFVDVLKLIYAVVGCWKEVVSEKQKMRHENVVEECALLCVEMCADLSVKADEKILRKADLGQDFVYLLYMVHSRPNQAGYFSMLNSMNEQTERLLNPLKQHTSIDIAEYEYEQMHRMALLMKSLTLNLDFGIEKNFINNKRTSCAYGILRVACYSRFREHCRRNGSTQDVEIMMTKVYGSIFASSSLALVYWLPKQVQEVMGPLISDKLMPVAFKSMKKTVRKVSVDLIYPLPLSIKWELERAEEGMTSSQVISCLIVSHGYRKFARELHQLHSSGKFSALEKIAILKTSRDKFAEICARRIPDDFNLFHRHSLVLTHSIKYDASIVHFSILSLDTNKYDGRGGMAREYLLRIAWWIDEVTKSVPVSEREEHLKMMLQFVRQEVSYLIPFDQKEVAELTIILMIEGGFDTNMIK